MKCYGVKNTIGANLAKVAAQTETKSQLHPRKRQWVVNLSSKPLSTAQETVLAHGPNFTVTPKTPLPGIILQQQRWHTKT